MTNLDRTLEKYALLESDASAEPMDIAPFSFHRWRAQEGQELARRLMRTYPLSIFQADGSERTVTVIEAPEATLALTFPPATRDRLVSQGYNVTNIEMFLQGNEPRFLYYVQPRTHHYIAPNVAADALMRTLRRHAQVIVWQKTEEDGLCIQADNISILVMEDGEVPATGNLRAPVFRFLDNAGHQQLPQILHTYGRFLRAVNVPSTHLDPCTTGDSQMSPFRWDPDAAAELEDDIMEDYEIVVEEGHISEDWGSFPLDTFVRLYQQQPLNNPITGPSYMLIAIGTTDADQLPFLYKVQPHVHHDMAPATITDFLWQSYLEIGLEPTMIGDDCTGSMYMSDYEGVEVQVLQEGQHPRFATIDGPVFTFQNTPDALEVMSELTRVLAEKVNAYHSTRRAIDDRMFE